MTDATLLAPPARLHAKTGLSLAGLAAAVVAVPLTLHALAPAAPAQPDPVKLARQAADTLSSSLDQVQPFFLGAANAAERERAVHCLTDAVYYEAAREPVEGQRAIAQVVVNRVRDAHFPSSICGVVYQGWERGTGCQFSFACDGSIRRRPADPTVWDRLRPIAEQALGGYVDTAVGTATHYHADYVKPAWIRTVAEKAEIGRHIFYSWRGKAGLPGALRQSYSGGEFQVAQAALDGLRGRARG